MGRPLIAIALLLLTACSQGTQTLYVASDRSKPLEVSIGGKVRETPTVSFQAYPRVALEKGSEVVVTEGGVEIDRVSIPPVPRGSDVLLLVGGAPTLQLVDYRNLAGVGRMKDRMIGPVRKGELEIVSVDRASKTFAFDERQ